MPSGKTVALIRMTQVETHFRDRTVCILGMGYVGLTLAVVMAEVGFEVCGIEIREDVVEALKRGRAHFHEPGIDRRLKRIIDTGRLRVETNVRSGADATAYVITVGTPLDAGGRVRMDMVTSTASDIVEVLQDEDLVIMRSTVKVGTTRQVVKPILKGSRKRFDLAFCPERTLEGRALEELRSLPQIVAGDGDGAQIRAAQLFQWVTPTVVRVSDIETAEMIKMVDNAQRDVAFAFSNEIALLCDSLGVSAAEVIRLGKLGYPRTDLPLPGPVGGPCLAKDPYILAESVMEAGAVPELTLAARRLNESVPEIAVAEIALVAAQVGVPEQPVISLLGLAFKGQPPTDDLRGTMAQPVLENLRRSFPRATFKGFDPEVAPEGVASFDITACSTLDEAFQGAHVVVILNNHEAFARMAIESLAEVMATPAVMYDFWNNFTASELSLPNHAGYIAFGSHAKASLPRSLGGYPA